jgi:hypothetical protein
VGAAAVSIAKGAAVMMKMVKVVAAVVVVTGVVVVSLLIGAAHGDGPVVAATSQPATATSQPQWGELGGRAMDVVQAIHLCAADANGKLPGDLGATLPFIQPWHASMKAADAKAKASLYLSPENEKKIKIPESPTGEWVNENASLVYLGNEKVVLSQIPSEKWGRTILVHEKLDQDAKKEFIVVAFVDAHSENVKLENAKEMIEESKKTLAAARVTNVKPEK